MSVTDGPDKSQGRLKFKRSKGADHTLYLAHLRDKESPVRRKSLSKNRIFLQTPREWYNYRTRNSPDVTSPHRRQENASRWSFQDSWRSSKDGGRRIVFDRIFHRTHQPTTRKAMIIGEDPSTWRSPEVRRPLLPGNLSMDSLRHQDLDWRKYNKLSWDDILESHRQDVDRSRVYVQTLPQKEHWLASIDNRARYSKPHSNLISPRLFNNKAAPSKAPVAPKYVSKDRQGNIFYIVGPGDVTSKELRPFVLPQIDKPPPTPEKMDF